MRRLTTALVAAVAFVAAVLGIALSSAVAVTPTRNVTARDAQGHVLGPNPSLRPGTTVTLTITGFAPGATVTLRLGGDDALPSKRADAGGRVVVALTVPRGAQGGSYVVTAQGPPRLGPTGPSDPTGPSSTIAGAGTADPQDLEAVVPMIGLFPFRVPGSGSGSGSGSGVDASSTVASQPRRSTSGQGVPGQQTASPGAGTGALSTTGDPLAQLLCIAALSLIVGSAVAALARRDRRGTHAR